MSVLGWEDCDDVSTAKTAIALLYAFSGEPGCLWFEPHDPRGSNRPPDLLLCTPKLGVLTVEVKGHGVEQIQGGTAGVLQVKYGGRIGSANVIDQARKAMFEAKSTISRRVEQHAEPFIDFVVVFPRIESEDWARHGLDKMIDPDSVLFWNNLNSLRTLAGTLHHRALKKAHGRPLFPDISTLEAVKSAFGDSSALQDMRAPMSTSQPTLGSEIAELAAEEKNLSAEQQELSRTDFIGHAHLIRGVAGSGKSIVLANNVARRLARRHRQLELFGADVGRDERIGVICFNRSLVPFLEAKIRTAFASLCPGEELPETLLIRHLEGMKHHFSQAGLFRYVSVGSAGGSTSPHYLEQIGDTHLEVKWGDELLDITYVDESQDFDDDDIRVMLQLTRTDPYTSEKSLVLFYDDAQNVYGRSRPTWDSLGVNIRGRSTVMKESFRNTREIVNFSFNVLVGSRAPEGTVAGTRLFADVAGLKRMGLIEERDTDINVLFAERGGPSPCVEVFTSRDEEVDFIASEISRLIGEEGLRPDDLLILFESDGKFSRAHIDQLEQRVTTACNSVRGFVHPHRTGHKDEFIFHEGCITVSTTRSAKGYDAYVVFVVGTELFPLTNEGRASFYVGCTRSKLLLTVTGLSGSQSLLDECVDCLTAAETSC